MDDVDALLAELAEWAAVDRVDDAVQARARERWLRQQAAEEAELAGLLADLADHKASLVVHTTAGRVHRGRVAAVGADVVVITGATRAVLVAIDAVAVIEPAGGGALPSSSARPRPGLTLTGALARLAQSGTKVLVGAGDDVVSGEVVAVGEDVLTIATGEGGTAYVRAGAVTDVVVPRSR